MTLTGWVYTTTDARDGQPVGEVLEAAGDRFGGGEVAITGVMCYDSTHRVAKLAGQLSTDIFACPNHMIYDSSCYRFGVSTFGPKVCNCETGLATSNRIDSIFISTSEVAK